MADVEKFMEMNFYEEEDILSAPCTETILPDSPGPSKVSSLKKRKKNSVRLPTRRKKKYLGMKGYEVYSLLVDNPIKFCQDVGLLASSVMCFCGEPMILSPCNELLDSFEWRCSKTENSHSSSMPVRAGTWFNTSDLPLADIMWIVYMWVQEYTQVSMLHECRQAKKAVVEWCTTCRDLCRVILECKSEPIGGYDQTVQIFEGKFKEISPPKKQKKGSKKKKSTQWVFCALQQFSTNSVFVEVENQNTKSLLLIFNKFILPGTTVFSHIWNPYKNLCEEDFDYLTNQKSITFFDSNTKTDLDTYDKFQAAAERPRPGLNYWNKLEFDAKFCEYMYRKSLSFAPDAYLAFLKDVAKLYRPQGRTIKPEPLDE